MTLSVMKDRQGPDWPLGLISVATPGTPVSIMSLVDASNYNDPATAAPTPATANQVDEYTVRAYGIIFIACKAGASHGVQINTGNIYIVRKGVQGNGNRDDYGAMVATLPPGATTGIEFPTFFLNAAPLNRNVFSPYRYFIDADNANDSCLVTLLIQ